MNKYKATCSQLIDNRRQNTDANYTDASLSGIQGLLLSTRYPFTRSNYNSLTITLSSNERSSRPFTRCCCCCFPHTFSLHARNKHRFRAWATYPRELVGVTNDKFWRSWTLQCRSRNTIFRCLGWPAIVGRFRTELFPVWSQSFGWLGRSDCHSSRNVVRVDLSNKR